MCNPIAVAMVVAGTALQANAQSRRAAAMKDAAADARALEAGRQGKLRDEREQTLVASQQGMGVDAQNSALADAAAKRDAAYDEAKPDSSAVSASYGTSVDSGTPKIVMEDAANKKAAAKEEVDAVGNARARLGSFGDVGLGNRITNSNAANQIGMLGGFARQSAGLLPGEVQAAMESKAGKGRNQELLGTALQMYGGAGAPGMFGGAAAAGAGSATAAGAGSAGTAGMYGTAINSGAAAGSVSPMASGMLANQGVAESMFPAATQGGAYGLNLETGTGIGGLLSKIKGSSPPLYGNETTKGYLPSWARMRSS